MAAIRAFLRPRKLQSLGKILILSMVLLACFIGYYLGNLPQKDMSINDKMEIVSYNLTIVDPRGNGTSSTKEAFGAVDVYIWRGLCGSDTSSLRSSLFFPRYPDENFRSHISKFQIEDRGISYGQLIFGFVHPPNTTLYRFAIVSDDTSELWLSSYEDPKQKQLIARVFKKGEAAWAQLNQLHKYPDQISKDIKLHKGSKYYIEVLHKQGTGKGFVQVFWKSLKDKHFKLINSEYLSPYSDEKDENVVARKNKDVLHSVLADRYRVELELKSKRISKDYLKFYSLPLVPKDSYLPSCDYESSFVLSRTVRHYEGIRHVAISLVYPEDNTTMGLLAKKSPNRLAGRDIIHTVVNKIATSLRLKTSKKYFVRRIHKILQKKDPVYGDRFSVDLELGLNGSSQSFRLSEHVFDKKLGHGLCFPEGMQWNFNTTVYFIIPVKDQGRWVYHFINELTVASLLTGDKNFHVIVADFESEDIDLGKAFDTSLLHSRHTIVSLKGRFSRTIGLSKAVERVPSEHDILFLFDLHIDVPVDIMDSVRKNTIEGRLVYMPIVGRLDCGSTYVDHQGYWETFGYGLVSVYKSDWTRFGGINTVDYKYRWGGEDWDLLDRLLNAKLEVERIKHPGLYHHYHTKRKLWK